MHAVSVSPLGGEELNGSRLERQEVGKRSGREEKEKPARHREATEESGRGWGLLFPIRRGRMQDCLYFLYAAEARARQQNHQPKRQSHPS